MEECELAQAWIDLQRLPQDSQEANDLMWAAEEINMLALRQPEKCWSVVMLIVKKTTDRWVLTNLAAGPLENLLSINGEEAISWLENEASANPRIGSLISDVWRSQIPSDVWKRISRLKRR